MRVFCFRASLTSVQQCSVRSLVFDCENPLHGLTHSLEEEKKTHQKKIIACMFCRKHAVIVFKTLKFVGIILFLFRYISLSFFFLLCSRTNTKGHCYTVTLVVKVQKKEKGIQSGADKRQEMRGGVGCAFGLKAVVKMNGTVVWSHNRFQNLSLKDTKHTVAGHCLVISC